MAVITYSAFRDRLRASIWPSPGEGEASTLRTAHNTMFQEAFHECQKWIRSLRLNNVTVIAACSTYVRNGCSMMEAPYGKYNKVYAIVAGRHDDPIFYNQTSYDEVLRWGNEIQPNWTEPPNDSVPPLELGFRYNDESGDSDSTVGRTRHLGKYALYQRNLWLAPYIQSYEEVVIDWNGEKRTWGDSDTLDETYWTQDVEMAIKAYVKWRHECDFGCLRNEKAKARLDAKQEFRDALAEAIYQDDQRLKIQFPADPDLIQRSPTEYELAIEDNY